MPLPAIVAPLVIGAASLASGLFTNAANLREARRNREFQERMSNTAHQREVRDLRAANLSPYGNFHGGGSSQPSGDRAQLEDAGSRGIASALALRAQKAQIDLTESQAGLVRAQTSDIFQTASAGRMDQLRSNADLAALSVKQQRELLPLVLERAREEIRLTVSSARKADASALLDEAASTGVLNMQEFEKDVGAAGPWLKMFFNLLRTLQGGPK